MSKTLRNSTMRILAVAGVVCLLLCLAFPAPVQAASPATRSIDIAVDLRDNGDAAVTEVWDVTTVDGTEFYLTKYYLYDQQRITDLVVTDETGREYTNIGTWDSNRSKDAKAFECGLIEINDGYEICWGLGAGYGDHVYTVRYTMTNLLIGYDEGDAINQQLVSTKLLAEAQSVSVTIRSDAVAFTAKEFDEEAQTQVNDGNTAVWGFGYDGEVYVQDGQVEYTSTGTLRSSQYVSVLVIFDKGLFHPAVERTDVTLDEMREEAMEGGSYTPPDTGSNNNSNGSVSIWNRIRNIVRSLAGLIVPFLMVIGFGALFRSSKTRSDARTGPAMTKAAYAQIPYSRELPYKGSLNCTYKRLQDTARSGIPANEGGIMGAYLLRWVRSKQVELITQQEQGWFKTTESVGIKLYNPRADMPALERSLYDILVAAAGPDWVLQSKELENYAKRNYTKVESWYSRVKSQAGVELQQMGATAVTPQKTFFGLMTTNVTAVTPYGQQLTQEMYGFKKYLEDFTIINERQAREVELWDDYLVFAQVFGIAEAVAEQFGQLYPKYFTDMQAQIGGMTMYDTITMIRLTNMISHAAYSGYRSGYNAAQASSYSSYSGGGGGFSGGGGGGGGGGFGSSGGGGTR